MLLLPQDGLLFGLPVVFDTHSDKVKVGDKVLLTYQGQNIATLTIDSKWAPNKPVEALKCYGTSSIEHPAVQMISMERGKYYIGVYRFPADKLYTNLWGQDGAATALSNAIVSFVMSCLVPCLHG